MKGENVPITKRLALCNYDWMNISAKDIMLLFNSFKPQAGSILKVEVYPSQIGTERMAEEEKKGPQNIWSAEDQTSVHQVKGQKWGIGHQTEKEGLDPEKLREYER